MSQGIHLIVGLGNPGQQYAGTRHNAGAWLVQSLHDCYAKLPLKLEKKFKAEIVRTHLHGHEIFLAIPTTFMNLSGEAVAAIAKFYKIPTEAILIAHDELDVPCGEIRLKQGGGHGGHNGLRSICQHLQSHDFYRLRIGIGHPGQSHLVTDYVLHKPNQDDRQLIETAINKGVDALPLILNDDLQKAMTQLHTT